jgi:pimeloyl-ACP methyl ester carboxylesterase
MNKIIKGFVVILLIVISIFVIFNENDISLDEAKKVLQEENSQFINIDGLDVHYKREGSGFPLVLVHGTGAILQTWDEWAPLFKDSFEVIRMDIPAFGLTGPRADGDYSIETYVKFINDFVEAIGVDSFLIAGNSLGGEIVWQYALHHPEKVGKMVLLDPAGIEQDQKKIHTLAFRLAKNEKLTGLVTNFGTKYLVRNAINDVYFDKSKVKDEKVHQYHIATLREGNRKAFISRVQNITYEPEEILQNIHTPTLVLWGDHDILIDVKMAEKYRNNMPNVEVIIYENIGHVPMEEIPEQSASDAMRFFYGR